MIRGLIIKTLHEVWLPTLLFGAALLAVLALLTYILPQVLEGIDAIWAQLPFAKTIFAALLGTDLGDELSARVMQAIVWVHPAVLAIVWAQEITCCTRVPAGELDRGTLDVLLGLPVPRLLLYACDSLVWLISGIVVLGLGLGGHLLAAQTMPAEQQPDRWRILLVLLNLYAVYLAVGGMACLVSTLSSRRGPAVAAVFALVVASFLLTFLAQFWEPAKRLEFLSVLAYYQPAAILRSGAVPWRNLLVLAAFGSTLWLVGGGIFHRRSLCTMS